MYRRLFTPSHAASGLALALLAACGSSPKPAPAQPVDPPDIDAPPPVSLAPDAVTFHQDLAWSPDGSRIAFSMRDIPRARLQANRAQALDAAELDIFVVDADGRNLRQVTNDEYDEMGVTWLPDGEQVAFASTRGRESAVYVIGVADGDPEAKQVTAAVSQVHDASWSPRDARMVAYAAKVDAHAQIYTTSITDPVARQRTREPFEHRAVVWSPDGTRLAFQGNPRGPEKDDIFVLTLEDGVVQAITNDDARDTSPGWLPDGRITFTTVDERGRKTVVARTLQSDQRVTLVEGAYAARVSPDFQRIAYIGGGIDDTSIFVRPIDPAAKPVKIVD